MVLSLNCSAVLNVKQQLVCSKRLFLNLNDLRHANCTRENWAPVNSKCFTASRRADSNSRGGIVVAR